MTASPPFPRAADGYFHPRSEADVQGLVRWARASGRSVRVRGAAHSVHAAIFAHAVASDRAAEVLLDRYDAVRFDDAARTVTAQAGVHLGVDPRDPTGRSAVEHGLCAQLHRRGWALPDLGGVSHQTVAGFLATGSAGGSLRHAFADAVVAMRLVDGTGAVRVFDRREDPDGLAGALVSLGLFGVVSEVTLRCEAAYDVVGEESVRSLRDAEVDLFADGPDGVAGLFARAEYVRLLWWPEAGVDRLVVWKARRLQPAEYDAVTGPPGALLRKPYEAFPRVLGFTLPMQAAAGLALRAIGSTPARVALAAERGGALAGLARRVTEAALAPVYRAFVPTDTDGPQRFRDTWWQGLPMDDAVEERCMPVSFLEVWVPVERAGEALRRLRDLFARGGYAASGNFAIELYPGAPSAAWLSPGHGAGGSLRVNVFCLDHVPVDLRRRMFAGVLGALDELGARLHWAKHLWDDPRDTADRTRRRFARFDDFLARRAELDPDGVFLTDYWRAHLGIAGVTVAPSFVRPATSTARFPLLFRLLPVEDDFADRAAGVFRYRARLALPPDEAFAAFAHDVDADQWIPWLGDARQPSGRLDGAGEVSDVNYRFMTVRVRYTRYEPGRLLRGSVDAWSLPFCERMAYEARFAPAPGGGTEFAWDIHYDPPPALRAFEPLVRPFFEHLFGETTARFAAYTARRAAARPNCT
jgi:D-arabinono-1,4-lactone oxidase